MDFENFFYVILAIIYFLSRVMRGRKKAPPAAPPSDDAAPAAPTKKPVTFEDLLKEFGVDQEEEQREPEYEEEEYEEAVVEEEPEVSPRYSDEESRSIFERSIREAEVPSEQGQGERIVFKEFEPYQDDDEEENAFSGELAEMLKSSDGAKKAVVLSEILNRKY